MVNVGIVQERQRSGEMTPERKEEIERHIKLHRRCPDSCISKRDGIWLQECLDEIKRLEKVQELFIHTLPEPGHDQEDA